MSLSIGIVGCGAIGQSLLRAADSGQLNVLVAGVTSRDEHRAHEFLGNTEIAPSLPGPPRAYRPVRPVG